MTTHLHPVDGLPVDATPICDGCEIHASNVDRVYVVTSYQADQLERRARTVEAQLAVAVEALNKAWKQVEIMSPVESTIEKALAEIAAIGGELVIAPKSLFARKRCLWRYNFDDAEFQYFIDSASGDDFFMASNINKEPFGGWWLASENPELVKEIKGQG